MAIGQMTVDSEEKAMALRNCSAPLRPPFRRPVAKPKDTGFLEVVSLGTPELFEPQALNSALAKMTLDVSGVDVASIVQFVNQIAKPAGVGR